MRIFRRRYSRWWQVILPALVLVAAGYTSEQFLDALSSPLTEDIFPDFSGYLYFFVVIGLPLLTVLITFPTGYLTGRVGTRRMITAGLLMLMAGLALSGSTPLGIPALSGGTPLPSTTTRIPAY